MAQFDVYRNPRSDIYPLLLDVQADLLSPLATRVVAPLTRLEDYGDRAIKRLNPTVTVEDEEYLIMFQEIAAIPATSMGELCGSLDRRRDDLIAAIDLLFTGI